MLNRRNAMGGMAALAGITALAPLRSALAQSAAEWRPLWDGRSLDGWTFLQDRVGTTDINHVVSISDGVLNFLGSGHTGTETPVGFLLTEGEHSNYHMRLEYRWGLERFPPRVWQARNSGVLYHAGPTRSAPEAGGKIFPECVEFQMMEGNAGDGLMIDTMGLQGPVLGGTPLWPRWIPDFPETYAEPTRSGGYVRQWHRHHGEFERLDGWNTLDLVAFADQSAHMINGRIVNTLFRLRKTLADGTQVPLTSGRIALEFEWAAVQFRNVMIRALGEADIATIMRQGSA